MSSSPNKTFIERNVGRLTPEETALYYKKLNEKNAKSNTILVSIISEQDAEKLIDAIEVQFIRKDARELFIKNEDMLDLYCRIYEDGIRRFNFVELGIISNMLFKDYPAELVEEKFGGIKEYLEFKVKMSIIPQTYHAISKIIDNEITEEMRIRKELEGQKKQFQVHKP